jgi:hypothetical protein
MRCKGVLFLILAALANEGAGAPPFPPGQPPHLWLASAIEQDGRVVIQVYEALPANTDDHFAADMMLWQELQSVVLGETVRAYGVDGELLDPQVVLAALENPTGVAVFITLFHFDPDEPPEFYLSLLQEDTVVLVSAADDLRGVPVP